MAGETLREVLCFCCSMSSSSLALASALWRFSSCSFCSISIVEDLSTEKGWIKKDVNARNCHIQTHCVLWKPVSTTE